MTLPPVTIVLSSYNGEQFIAQQIASIQRQRHAHWTLVVRDDADPQPAALQLQRRRPHGSGLAGAEEDADTGDDDV